MSALLITHRFSQGQGETGGEKTEGGELDACVGVRVKATKKKQERRCGVKKGKDKRRKGECKEVTEKG